MAYIRVIYGTTAVKGRDDFKSYIMGRVTKNSVLYGLKGAIAKQIVLKTYQDKTVVTVYPDMSRVKRSYRQKSNNSLFGEAVKYAQKINRNSDLKAAYAKNLPKGASVYHAAISEFMGRGGK